MTIKYPKLDTDWEATTYGASFNDGVRFPHGTIFYARRSDGSVRFAYVNSGKLYDGTGNVCESNGMSLITSLVDSNKRKQTWTCGQLKVILPDSNEHIDADYYRKNFEAVEPLSEAT